MNLQLLKRLSEVSGVSGREERVTALVRAELEGLADEVRQDALGNLIALKRGTGKRRVMLSAHMDEIGFMVSHVDEKGYLRVQPLGGFDLRNLFARGVTVCAKGGDLSGILNPAALPTHIADESERKKIPPIKDFVVDLGLPPDEVQAKVRVGDPVTLDQTFREVGNLLVGKALDNRACVYVQLEVLRVLKGKPHADDVYAVFSVQEEIGLRGALTAAYGIEPDVGVALDTTLAVNYPRLYPEDVITVAGGGVGIKLFDSSMISTRWLVDEFIAAAEQHEIPYQLEVLPMGGTDGGAIQRSRAGVPNITLSLPTRYIHTIQEAIHRVDLEAQIRLLTVWLEAQ
jgi:putative aminopeptidase FrvX